MSNFSLAEHLTRFQTSDKRSYDAVEEPVNELNIVTDRLAVSPEQIDFEPETLESLIDLCHGFVHLPVNLQTQLCYLIASSMGNLAQEISTNINGGEVIDLLPQWKRNLEEYGYLSHVILSFLQDDIHIASSQSSTLSRGGSKKSTGLNNKTAAGAATQLFKRTVSQIESLCEAVLKVLAINLSKLFQTTPEKDLFIGLFTRPLNGLLEFEATIKVASLKFFIQKIMAMSVKFQNQSSNAQNTIMTNLTYFLHLSNYNAELLKMINDEYNYPQLTEEILREISSRIFNSKDTNGPKSISNFLTKLSELSPQIMLRQMSLVIRLLNNSSIALRCSVVEACGNIVTGLALDEEALEHYKQQISVLLELLEERFQDSNPYVRTKAIQGCLKICDLDSKFNKSRINFTRLAVRSLQDRSSLVRRNAVKLLSKLLLKHPFRAMDGDQLKLKDWESHLSIAEKSLRLFLEKNSLESSLDDILDDPESDKVGEQRSEINLENNSPSMVQSEKQDDQRLARLERESEAINTVETEAILKMKLMIVYHKDAIEFIKEIHRGLEVAANLLFSRNRNEVLETMDLLVMADAYGLEPSRIGIKKMLHLVWMRGTNDEGTSISAHLISCYTQLFLTAPDSYNYRERATLIAKNLIKLTIGASVADLASLEQLLGMMYNEKLIDENIINVLWVIYTSVSKLKKDSDTFTTEQVHGSVIVLGMLSATNNEIALRGLESLLDIGLGKAGDADLILCRYTCLTLERMVPRKSTAQVVSVIGESREEVVVKNLYSKIITYTEDPQWYPMCEQALNALFTISSKPDIVAAALVREKIMITFGKPEDDDSMIQQPSSRVTSLSHLLFIAGQVSIKVLVYLEKCETEFKRRKIEAESNKGKEKDLKIDGRNNDESMDESANNELEMIGGTNEDDFTDAINYIKENELLFGENSILSKLSPIVEEIVSNSTRFNDIMLQRTAALCLEKFMCVSSKYCEKSLSLLITVMEKSTDPIVRSNAVLGLGDMAVCFNNLIDENTDYLYRRLHDENLMVQRTCLMTVTFLILAGQVKVKGQLSQMAKCLENADNGISDMCRLFFTELASKDNAIYNGFIDIFSNLSCDEELNKDSFKKIIKFLLSFIEKEKQQRQLTDKLLGRLNKCDSQKQWDDIAFVLNTIPYKNEKITAILDEGFKMVSAIE